MSESVRALYVGADPERARATADRLAAAAADVDVESATTADEALAAVFGDDADCLLVDREFAAGDALSLLARVRDAAPAFPVVFWPRGGDERLASDAFARGATDYVPRPADPDAEDRERLLERLRERVAESRRSATADRAGAAPESDDFRAVAQSITDVVITIDAESRIQFVNDAVAETFGYDPDALVGESLSAIMPDRLAAAHERALARYVRTGEKRLDWSSIQITGERRDGTEIPLEVSFGEFERSGRRLFTGVLRDVSGRAERAETLAELNATARSLMAAETVDEIAEITVETAREVLDLPITSLFRYDADRESLVPVASTDEARDLFGGVPSFEAGESLSWQTYEEGELRQFADVRESDAVYDRSTPIRAEIQVPLGRHGVLVTGSTDTREFDEYEVDLAKLLTATAEAAMDRAAREAVLRERERELRENEARFRQIGETLDAVIWLADPAAGELLYETPGGERLWGRSRTAAAADPEAFRTLVHESDRAAVSDILEPSTAREYDVEYRVRREDGGVRWIHERAVPIDGGGGRVVGFAEDVTARKEREQELEQFEAIFRAVQDRVYVLDEDGRFEMVNDPLRAMLGFERGELLGRHVSAVVDDPTVELGREAVESLVAGERESVVVEVDVRADEGATIPCEVEIAALDDGGEFQGSVGVVRDVSDRKRVKAQLQQERDRLSELFENVPDPVVEVRFEDDEPIVRSVNDSFESVFGYDASSVVGESLNEFVLPPDADERGREIDRRTRGERVNVEVRRQTSDGIRYFLLRGIPVGADADDDGADEGFGIYTDITTQKRRQRQLQVLNRVLRHNLRNDMNVIVGYAELLAEQVDGALAESTRAITEKAREVAGLSEKARMVESTLDDGADMQDAFDVVELIGDVRERYADREDVTVALDAPVAARVTAHHRLDRALENVLENAVEHSDRDRATVEIDVRRTGEFVAIEIRDDGPGIPAAEREVLTGEREISQLDHGSGLGLWLVNWIVTASGGEVTFGENEPRGSVVTLRLRALDDGES